MVYAQHSRTIDHCFKLVGARSELVHVRVTKKFLSDGPGGAPGYDGFSDTRIREAGCRGGAGAPPGPSDRNFSLPHFPVYPTSLICRVRTS